MPNEMTSSGLPARAADSIRQLVANLAPGQDFQAVTLEPDVTGRNSDEHDVHDAEGRRP